MEVGVVVQARMSSSRLPGKVLRTLAGKPVLDYLLDGLRRSTLGDRICVATSDEPADAGIAEFCRLRQVSCHRGPLADVAGRCLQAASQWGWDALVRISGDSPLLDYRLVDRAAELARCTGADLVTNVFPRTFPRGMSVEVIRTQALRDAHSRMEESRQREHVTTWFYEHADQVRLASFQAERPRAEVQLALDTPDDLQRLSTIVARMTRPHWEYRVDDLLRLHDQLFPWNHKDAA